jgi:hypothetical protein
MRLSSVRTEVWSCAAGHPLVLASRAIHEHPFNRFRVEQQHSLGRDARNSTGFSFTAQPSNRDAQPPSHRSNAK